MPYIGQLAALGTALCWGTGANLFAAAGARFGAQALNRLRIAFALVFLATALLITRGVPWPTWATPFQIGVLALSGLVGYVFGDGFGFVAIVNLGPGRSTLVSSLAPLFTVAFAWPLLGERPGPLLLLGMALLLGGLSWVLLERVHETHEEARGRAAVGIFAGVMGAIGQAGGYVLSKIALKTGIDPLSATLIRVTAAMIALWGFAVLRGNARSTLALARGDGVGTAFAAGGAFAGPFLGVTLSLFALTKIEAGTASAITAFYPIVAILIAMRFHHEKVTPRLILGALVAVVGVIILFLH